MKTHIRLTPSALMIFASLFVAYFILASSSIILQSNVASAQTRSVDQRLIKLRTDIKRLIKQGTYVPALVKARLFVRLSAKKIWHPPPELCTRPAIAGKGLSPFKAPR